MFRPWVRWARCRRAKRCTAAVGAGVPLLLKLTAPTVSLFCRPLAVNSVPLQVSMFVRPDLLVLLAVRIRGAGFTVWDNTLELLPR